MPGVPGGRRSTTLADALRTALSPPQTAGTLPGDGSSERNRGPASILTGTPGELSASRFAHRAAVETFD